MCAQGGISRYFQRKALTLEALANRKILFKKNINIYIFENSAHDILRLEKKNSQVQQQISKKVSYLDGSFITF